MKIQLTFKTPDVCDVIDSEFEKDEDGEMTATEVKMRNFVDEYIRYGEYIYVEFDSDTQEVKVLKLNTRNDENQI